MMYVHRRQHKHMHDGTLSSTTQVASFLGGIHVCAHFLLRLTGHVCEEVKPCSGPTLYTQSYTNPHTNTQMNLSARSQPSDLALDKRTVAITACVCVHVQCKLQTHRGSWARGGLCRGGQEATRPTSHKQHGGQAYCLALPQYQGVAQLQSNLVVL